MSNPKNNTIPETINIFLVTFAITCLDIFFFQTDLTVIGDSFYARFICFIVIFGYLYFTKNSVTVLGLSKSRKKITTGIVYGSIFSLIPLITVSIFEALFYFISKSKPVILKFSTPNTSHVNDSLQVPIAVAVIIYFLATFFGSAFKEFFFRGFLLKRLKTAMDFKSANLIQALLYMSLTIPTIIRNIIKGYYNESTIKLSAFIILFYIVHETLAGLKWGLVTRVTGCTYVATVDHLLYVFFSNSIYITSKYETWSFMSHMLMIQIVSFLFVVIYYKKNMKKLAEKRNEEAKKHKELLKKKSEEIKEREKNGVIDEKLQVITEISPDQYKSIVEQANKSRHNNHHKRHSTQRTQLINDRNSKDNEGKIETVNPENASEIAENYHSERLTSSRFQGRKSLDSDNSDKIEDYEQNPKQHTAKQQRNDDSSKRRNIQNTSAIESYNSDKLETYTSGSVSKKTEAYYSSQKFERSKPSRPHRHDYIGIDGQLTTEELDEKNSDKIDSFTSDDIDKFLRDFSEKQSSRSRHHTRTTRAAAGQENEDVQNLEEGFNVDEYLKNYHSEKSAKESAHHHSHHSAEKTKQDVNDSEEVASLSDVTTENFYNEYQKAIQKKEKNKRESLIKRIKEMGLIDDSDSNDLI